MLCAAAYVGVLALGGGIVAGPLGLLIGAVLGWAVSLGACP